MNISYNNGQNLNLKKNENNAQYKYFNEAFKYNACYEAMQTNLSVKNALL